MKKFSILLVIVNIAFSYNLVAQNTFAKVYDVFHPGNEKALNIIQFGEEYFVTGNGNKLSQYVPNSVQNFSALRIDNQGELLKQSYSKYYSNQSPQSILKDGEDIYMVLSNKKQTKDFDTRLYIYHTNINGDSLGMIRINHEDSIFLENRGIVKIKNSFYLFNYILRDVHKVFPWKIIVSQLIKVNQEGETELLKEFDFFHIPENLYIKETSKLVLFQHHHQHKNPDGTGEDTENIAVFSFLDTLGNNILHKEFIYPISTISKPTLVISSDSTYVINLSSKNDSSRINNYLLKLDIEGNEIWQYSFKTDSIQPKELKRIDGLFAASYGDVLGFGFCENYRLNGEIDNIKSVPWIFRISSEGEMIWEKYLFEDLDNYWFGAHFSSLIEDSNNDILLVGDYRPSNLDSIDNGNKYFTFAVKLDSAGCFSADCDANVILDLDWIDTIDALYEHSIENISIYPNPSLNHISISTFNIEEYSIWEIYDVLGNVIKKGIINPYPQIDISNLQSGLYFIKLLNNNNNIAIGKFIKQ